MHRRAAARFAALVFAGSLVAGCSSILLASPEPTPTDFAGIAAALADHGIAVGHIVSGDDGCHDPTLTPTAIGFDANGPGVTVPIRMRIYIFRTGETFDRRRPDVDPCVAKWATDPANVEFVDARPFALAGQGPWPDEFKTAIRAALLEAAGNGD